MAGMKKILTGALLGATLLPVLATAAEAPAATFTPEQEARIGKIAADYLVAHPEVLLQASQKLQQIQQEQQASAATQAVMQNQAALTQDKNTPTYGPADGKVTVIEFFDYQCIYCSRLAPVMEQVIKAHPQTRFAFKEWPIFGSRWETSLTAAKTGLQIYQQKGAEAYLTYHNGIYATGHNEGKLTAADVQQQAKKVNFDAKKAADVDAVLQSTNTLAQEIGLSGTPGVIVMPTTGATEATITVFPGLADKDSLEAAIKKAGGN
ncbi:DsbA family protein [Klebsiella sp. B345]|uniref:DsbA family protein n=1 Tax=Klebsiella sp. B345 TaxID=2755398 RepID=UPI003DA8FDFE